MEQLYATAGWILIAYYGYLAARWLFCRAAE